MKTSHDQPRTGPKNAYDQTIKDIFSKDPGYCDFQAKEPTASATPAHLEELDELEQMMVDVDPGK